MSRALPLAGRKPHHPRLRRALAAGLVALSLGLTGCASEADNLAKQYREGSGKGFVAGDGTIVEFPASQRGDAVRFSGTDERGRLIDSRDYAGRVLVVNFWYAGCAPCRAEAPLLNEVSESLDPGEAVMLGVNVRDQAETALTFAAEFDVEFPSIMDAATGSVQLAFAGSVPANAVPTTLVLDAEGRVAARILGRITEASILTTIINDLVAEAAK